MERIFQITHMNDKLFQTFSTCLCNHISIISSTYSSAKRFSPTFVKSVRASNQISLWSQESSANTFDGIQHYNHASSPTTETNLHYTTKYILFSTKILEKPNGPNASDIYYKVILKLKLKRKSIANFYLYQSQIKTIRVPLLNCLVPRIVTAVIKMHFDPWLQEQALFESHQ